MQTETKERPSTANIVNGEWVHQKFVDQIELMADGIYPYDFVHVPDQHEVGRPPATTLAMRCDGVETGDLITLNPDGTWKATQRLNIAGGHS